MFLKCVQNSGGGGGTEIDITSDSFISVSDGERFSSPFILTFTVPEEIKDGLFVIHGTYSELVWTVHLSNISSGTAEELGFNSGAYTTYYMGCTTCRIKNVPQGATITFTCLSKMCVMAHIVKFS